MQSLVWKHTTKANIENMLPAKNVAAGNFMTETENL